MATEAQLARYEAQLAEQAERDEKTRQGMASLQLKQLCQARSASATRKQNQVYALSMELTELRKRLGALTDPRFAAEIAALAGQIDQLSDVLRQWRQELDANANELDELYRRLAGWQRAHRSGK